MSVGLSASSYIAVERDWRTDASHSDFSRTDRAENVTKEKQPHRSMLERVRGILEPGESQISWLLSRSPLRKTRCRGPESYLRCLGSTVKIGVYSRKEYTPAVVGKINHVLRNKAELFE